MSDFRPRPPRFAQLPCRLGWRLLLLAFFAPFWGCAPLRSDTSAELAAFPYAGGREKISDGPNQQPRPRVEVIAEDPPQQRAGDDAAPLRATPITENERAVERIDTLPDSSGSSRSSRVPARNTVNDNPIEAVTSSPTGQNAHTPLSAAAQAEYLRALDKAGISDPGERADLLSAIEATDPAYRAIYLRTLTARREPAVPRAPSRAPRATAEEISQQTNLPTQDESHIAADRQPQVTAVSANAPFANPAAAPTPPVNTAAPLQSVNSAATLALNVPAELPDPESTHVSPRTIPAATVAAASPPDSPEAALLAALSALETGIQRGQGNLSGAPNQRELMRVRLLQALAGQTDAALEPITGLNPQQQEFLNLQVSGLAALLAQQPQASAPRRLSLAAEHLRNAAEQLGQSAGLIVRNLQFCTEIKGFGTFTRFAKEVFKPGQDLLLYAELDHFTTSEHERGFHTKFAAKYQVLDGVGQRVVERDLILAEEICQNRRRDYFVSYFIKLPENLNPGEYSLKLIVTDQFSGQFGESALKFSIAEQQTKAAALSPESAVPLAGR
ncbi:MAG: hypothetical protein SFX18_11510 [Pirellulales bacterium]|nr:hypothetical protein [Pirellulales bacterium]